MFKYACTTGMKHGPEEFRNLYSDTTDLVTQIVSLLETSTVSFEHGKLASVK